MGLQSRQTFRDYVFPDTGAKHGLAVGEPGIGCLSGAFELQLIALFGLGVCCLEETDCSL